MNNTAELPSIAGETSLLSKAPWLLYLEQELVPESLNDFTGVEAKILSLIRDMLLSIAASNVESIVDNAVQQIQKCYITNYLKEESPDRQQTDHGAEGLLHSVCTFVFDLASQLPYVDAKHEALALLLVGLKANAPMEFNNQNPQLIYMNGPLLMVSGEAWNNSHVGDYAGNDRDLKNNCSKSVNVSAFIARLLNEGMLGADGLHWAGRDLMVGLETAEFDSKDQTQVCQATIAVLYILLAGRLIAQEVRQPTVELTHPLTRGRWTIWASRLEDISRAAPDDAEWCLGLEAKKAHKGMVTLYSEIIHEY
ncbi:hypothetical protein BKA67DRAFT_551727 [Truncatella angustata]|uniref:Uncharacterized protein n=1 Tax=Truncatella angustata TaxID=152316 RepID=A0A9P8UQH7_9PEZI|nr:uncharacterized protein BKA67DRAFT_551727 [Truncatella angustata]KAH6656364.1 hypothetical protein BKA67DRAFT_551727 [Truncatella angustata]KAH8198524.1 hypothetical protein TruAng_007303 [Truncatella angustata]